MINNQKLFSLINVANVETGLLARSLVRTPEQISEFRCISRGIPILIPADPELFIFKKSDVFSIDSKQILETIYGLSDDSYVGFLHAFKFLNFLSNYEVRDEYMPALNAIIRQNETVANHVSAMRCQGETIGAFQTRNVPHFGHEEIMRRMLDHCDH